MTADSTELPHVETPTATDADPALVQLPPFSGEISFCSKCANLEAFTWYRPAERRHLGEWNGQREMRGPLPGRLERQCQRCNFQWEEALVSTTASATELDKEELARLLTAAMPNLLEYTGDGAHVAARLLEIVEVRRRLRRVVPDRQALSATRPGDEHSRASE